MSSEAQVKEIQVQEIQEDATAAVEARRLICDLTLRLRTVEEACATASYLAAWCTDPQQEIGIQELLINAVEHGNLGITYEEKSACLAEGTMLDEITRRLALPEYRDRVVTVELCCRDGVEILISDEGSGFDFERFLEFDPQRLFHRHGRGVLMAKAALSIEYLPPGNRVRIRIPPCAETAPAQA